MILCVGMLRLMLHAVADMCCGAVVKVCAVRWFGVVCCCGKRVLKFVVWCCWMMFM